MFDYYFSDAVQYNERKEQLEQLKQQSRTKPWLSSTVMSTDVTRDWRNADDTCVPDVLVIVLLLGVALVLS